jgi:uncharacterized damage-inducible protein DinB
MGETTTMKSYRKGALGALMDEYERASSDLKLLLREISEDDYIRIIDAQTKDENCRTVQTIISHVVGAGYSYADYIRECFGIASTRPARMSVPRLEAESQINSMLEYTANTLEGRWEMREEEIAGVEINSSWGVRYDLEQLLEHAIVHVLRHRRQIERLLEGSRMSARTGV